MNPKNSLVPVEVSTDLAEPMTISGMGGEDTAAPLKKVHSVMRGRYLLAITLGLIFATMGAAAGWLGPSMLGMVRYRSQAVIRIEPYLAPVLKNVPEKSQMPLYDAFVNSQAAMITSQRVLNQAWKNEKWRSVMPTMTDEDRAKFMRRLTVTHPQSSELIFIYFEHDDPAVAVKAVQSIVAAYQELYIEKDVKTMTDTMQQLETLRGQLRDSLNSVRKRRRAIGQELGTDDLRPVYSQKLGVVNKIEAELKEVEMSLAAAQAAINRRGIELQGAPGQQNQPQGGNQQQGPAPAGGENAGQQANAAGNNNAAPNNNANADPNAAKNAAPAMALTPVPEPAPAVNLTVEEIAAVDAKMAQYLQLREQFERQVSRETISKGPGHRVVIEARHMLADLNQTIEEHAAFYRQQLSSATGEFPRQLRQLQERYLIIKAIYDQARQELVDVGQKSLSISELQQEEYVTDQKLREVSDRIDTLNIEQQMSSRVKILSEGETPLEPITDKRKLLAAAGGMGGMGFGIGIVLLIGVLDRRFRSIHDATDSFSRIAMLGILPRLPEDLADPEEAAVAARCVHQIRTLLQIGPDSQGRRVFSITSPGPHDGKTSLTMALGLSFATSGAKTLLVDCDLTGGSLTRHIDTIIRRKIGQILQREQIVTEQQIEQALRLAQESNRRLGETLIELGYLRQSDLDNALSLQEEMPVGLLDAVAGEPLEGCIAETGIENLYVLPVGAAMMDDVAKLSPGAIRRLLDEARKQFDVVLIDTGSVPASLEASHMAPESDGVVLIVSKGEQRTDAQRAIDHLQSIGARIAGLVFNRAEGRDLEVIPESSSTPPESAIVRRSRRSAKEYDTSKRFGPVARAVVGGNGNGNGNGNGGSERRGEE